jgi:hypothetical protein
LKFSTHIGKPDLAPPLHLLFGGQQLRGNTLLRAKREAGIEGFDVERAEEPIRTAEDRADENSASAADEHLGGVAALSEAIHLEFIADLES